MNTEQAIKAVEKGYVAVGDALYIPDGNTALKHIILTALCEKQERENPKPLTLEELREKVEGEGFVHGWIKEVSNNLCVPCIIDMTIDEIVGVWCANMNDVYHEADYGKKWLFFDHEPKEAHKGEEKDDKQSFDYYKTLLRHLQAGTLKGKEEAK
jgi:hypothetical protein